MTTRKRISDEFVITIGEGYVSKCKFICDSTRKGATVPEPFDNHSIPDWIIAEFGLKESKKYCVKVTVTLLDMKEKKSSVEIKT